MSPCISEQNRLVTIWIFRILDFHGAVFLLRNFFIDMFQSKGHKMSEKNP